VLAKNPAVSAGLSLDEESPKAQSLLNAGNSFNNGGSARK